MSPSSSLRKYLTKEDLLQEEILRMLARKYPDITAIHVPNEGKRSDFEQLKFKVLGGQEGVSDLLLVGKSMLQGFNGMWVEVKYGRNKLTESQYQFMVNMYYAGFAVAVVYDASKDLELILDRYFEEPYDFSKGIALGKDADLRFCKFEEFKMKYVKKKSAVSVKRDAQQSFANKAKARFGKSLSRSSLPNAGKLFQSPKK